MTEAEGETTDNDELPADELTEEYENILQDARENIDGDMTEERFNEVTEGIEGVNAQEIAEWFAGGSWEQTLDMVDLDVGTEESEEGIEIEGVEEGLSHVENPEPDWDNVSYVISSGYRENTLKALGVQPDTPSNIEKRTTLDVAHISRSLKELREKDLVQLLVSEDRKKGRIYDLTDEGEQVAAYIITRK